MVARKAETVALECVFDVRSRLQAAGLRPLLFGGWAAEALGLAPPLAHGDIDLLLPAESFCRLDAMLADAGDLQEVPGKRFHHKRAFLVRGTLVELVLVRREGDEVCTWFWGDRRFRWGVPLSQTGHLEGWPVPCVSADNLRRFHAAYRSTEPWRWRDSASLVSLSRRRQGRGRELPPEGIAS